MKRKLTKTDILTIPNGLSLFRILLIPLFVWLYVKAQAFYAAVAVVALSGLTDFADGYIARHFNMVSDVGKVLDPVADKLTQAALLICLASRWSILYWVFALFCLKELLQGLLGYAVIQVTGEVQSAHWYGKISTCVFYGVMLLLLLFPAIPETGAYILIGLCAAVLMVSMILYVRYDLNILWGVLFPSQSRKAVVLKVLMLLMWAAVIVFCWLHRDAVTVDGILRITPRSQVLAVLFMLGLFALKSLSVVVYCGILYTASGILFPLPLAILVNLLGTGIMAAIPYALGRHTSSGALDRYISSRKNISLLRQLRTQNTFLYTLLVRVINILPFDVVSAYFGASQTEFMPYLWGSILGMAPPCVLFAILGTSITNPGSPQFILSAAIELAIMLVSFLLLLAARKKAGTASGEAVPSDSGDAP